MRNSDTYSDVDDVRLKLFVQLRRLVDRLSEPNSRPEFARTYFLLDALPLATGEFDLACNRVKNAQRYTRSSEYGAAKYELGLVIAWVKSTLLRHLPKSPAMERTEIDLDEPSLSIDLAYEDSRFC